MRGIYTNEELAPANVKECDIKKGAVQLTEAQEVAPPPSVTPSLPKGMVSKVEMMPVGGSD